ncbi:hypothetical protein ACROYT_G003469 [Oculina patagonica]
MLSALKDSGAIDVTLEECKQSDDSTMEIEDDCRQAEHNNIRCHQGTQTELFLLSITDNVVQKSQYSSTDVMRSTENRDTGKGKASQTENGAGKEVLRNLATCPLR